MQPCSTHAQVAAATAGSNGSSSRSSSSSSAATIDQPTSSSDSVHAIRRLRLTCRVLVRGGHTYHLVLPSITRMTASRAMLGVHDIKRLPRQVQIQTSL